MSLYPLLATELGFNDRQAGFLIGASIHDVAQAIGGGYAFSDVAGSHATIVKLARVSLLAPIVAVISLIIAEPDGPRVVWWRRISLPWFILAFLAMVAFNSLVALPLAIGSAALSGSKILLLLAVTATAMRTRLDLLLAAGWRGAIPVVAATLTSLVVALLCARLMV